MAVAAVPAGARSMAAIAEWTTDAPQSVRAALGARCEEVPAFAPLLDRCASLPWHQVPELDRTRDRAHGRVEIRTLKAVSVRHLGFPTPPRSSRSPQDPDACHPAVSSGAVSL